MGDQEAKCSLVHRLVHLQAGRVCPGDPARHSPENLTQQPHVAPGKTAPTSNGEFLIRLSVKNVQLVYVSTEELLQDL